MGPTRTVKSSAKSVKGSRPSSKTSAPRTSAKGRVSKKPKALPPKQQKTKPAAGPAKKKKRIYTDKELGIPKLNMITPVGVDLPKGKKKGKVFVDDQVGLENCKSRISKNRAHYFLLLQESMMTILAIVNANKEGQIESKMMKSRQMEEIREARRKEAEARQEQRKSKMVRYDEIPKCKSVANIGSGRD